MSYLKGANGNNSSKRLMGLGYGLLGIVVILAMTFFDGIEVGFDILVLIVSTALTSLGISSLEYFGKSENLGQSITPPPGNPPGDEPDN